jgi:hypothetical protein
LQLESGQKDDDDNDDDGGGGGGVQRAGLILTSLRAVPFL